MVIDRNMTELRLDAKPQTEATPAGAATTEAESEDSSDDKQASWWKHDTINDVNDSI